MAIQSVPDAFEGSARQATIIKLREVEERLTKLKALAQLLERVTEDDEHEAIYVTVLTMVDLADEGLKHLNGVAR